MSEPTRVHSLARRALRFVALGLAAGITLVGAISVATPAMAHNYYIGSTPGTDEVLTVLPDEFIVTTNDNLLELDGAVGGFLMTVEGPDGLYYGDGCVSVHGPSVSMPAALGPAGDYTLEWQVISADGHTVSGTIPFQWQPTAGQESVMQGTETIPNCGGPGMIPSDKSEASNNAEVSTDILWIGGAILAVTLALVATLLLLRPKKKSDDEIVTDETAPDGTTPKKAPNGGASEGS